MTSRYRALLESLSKRTNTSLPSLVLSFGVLHELTAIVPVVVIFFGARSLGVGDRFVNATLAQGSDSDNGSWVSKQATIYAEEGVQWAERFGRRYGVFGFQKRDEKSVVDAAAPTITPGHIAGDVTNAILAYGITKALLPVRIGLSLWLSPPMARAVVDPMGRLLRRTFKR